MRTKDVICPHCGKDFYSTIAFGGRNWVPRQYGILMLLDSNYPNITPDSAFDSRIFPSQQISQMRRTMRDAKLGLIERKRGEGWRLIKGENWPSVENSSS